MTVTKSEAQIQHEVRNAALKAEAQQRKAERIEGHEQRNAERAYEAFVNKVMRKTANDNRVKLAKAA